MTALSVGLKVDVDALPAEVVDALRNNAVDLTDPAVTRLLLQLNAVVGVKGHVEDGRLTSIGITCALCHSTVDDSFMDGIGKRLDGWANRDLNVGAILALSPAPEFTEDLKSEFMEWGPGMYDPRHHAFDGMNFISLHTPTLPIVIPSIYGPARCRLMKRSPPTVPFRTGTAMSASGKWADTARSVDPRIGLVIRQSPDLVTPKLEDLLAYQLSLRTLSLPKGASIDRPLIADAACFAMRRAAQTVIRDRRSPTC
jgi:hypothetical protein